MTATHWIAIAAIMMPLITSWLQFWLKERSAKAVLTTAAQATIQPKTEIQPGKRVGFGVFLRRRWVWVVIQWLLNITAVLILLRQYHSQAPVTHGSVILVALTTTLWLLLTVFSVSAVIAAERNSD